MNHSWASLKEAWYIQILSGYVETTAATQPSGCQMNSEHLQDDLFLSVCVCMYAYMSYLWRFPSAFMYMQNNEQWEWVQCCWTAVCWKGGIGQRWDEGGSGSLWLHPFWPGQFHKPPNSCCMCSTHCSPALHDADDTDCDILAGFYWSWWSSWMSSVTFRNFLCVEFEPFVYRWCVKAILTRNFEKTRILKDAVIMKRSADREASTFIYVFFFFTWPGSPWTWCCAEPAQSTLTALRTDNVWLICCTVYLGGERTWMSPRLISLIWSLTVSLLNV